jgi:hypothetical protein
VQYVFQKYIDNNLEKMKKSLKFTIIPVLTSIICYIFSSNVYIWIIGVIIFGCSDIIIFTIISTVMQFEVKKEIQGRVFTLGYNIRVCLCAVGSIIITLTTYYNVSQQNVMVSYLVLYFCLAVFLLIRERN